MRILFFKFTMLRVGVQFEFAFMYYSRIKFITPIRYFSIKQNAKIDFFIIIAKLFKIYL